MTVLEHIRLVTLGIAGLVYVGAMVAIVSISWLYDQYVHGPHLRRRGSA